MSLFIPTYFSQISQYKEIINSDLITFEFEDNFQKQTYRNRCYIHGSNGKLILNIPIKHTNSSKKSKDIEVENNTWQKQHLKSIQTAYFKSPFFEFYEDDLLKIFNKKYKFLYDVNIDSFQYIMDSLAYPNHYLKTNSYENNIPNDFRYLVNAKQTHLHEPKQYVQMFDDKNGFIPDLSILDLLFMEGPNSISFLN